MANFSFLNLLFVVLFSIAPAEGAVAAAALAPEAAIKGAYYPSWFSSGFPPSSIETSLFTHILYAFLSPSNTTYKFEVSDSTAPLLSNFIAALRQKSPPVKTLISIGGGGAGPALYATIASSASTRKLFIDSSIEVARKYGFDGLDLDWEMPENPKQMADLGLLFQEWRNAITRESKATARPPLLLTAAVYFAVDFFLSGTYRKYPVASMNQNLDWINAMCYDYHGSWDTSATGAHAAFFDPNSNISSSYGLRSWIQAGLPRKKVVMGLPLYGRTWELKDPSVHGIGAPAVGLGPGKDGVLTYSQVETFNKKNNATVQYDATTVSTYSFKGTSWVGYDDVVSTATKVGLAQALGLRGYFFWALSYDKDWRISTQASRAWIYGK
ncbi:class V chitinase CHIT5b-like [Rhodamnia argentea]|uniref:Class V chitinase CHIT5b-like n=1 Tax=Rhodamnia argentea TaxID=178133 RepID=A0A8B8QBK5_9MYRT|nr:class V chitinase CHIT5b-like [Rhodamnia argentea]